MISNWSRKFAFLRVSVVSSDLIARYAAHSPGASLNALNVANRRVIYDDSVTYGGFHWNLPREIYVQVRYRFRY